MKLCLLSVFLLVGCGGAPFSEGLVDPVEASAEAGDEVGDPQPDAGRDSAPEAGGGDSASWVAEAGEAGYEGGTVDSGVDTGAVEAGVVCPGYLPCNVNRNWPGAFCLVRTGGGDDDFTAPAACNSCGTYTCACILANSTFAVGCACSLSSDGAAMVVCP
jgi:hypothetical protein